MSRTEKPIDWNKVDQLLMAGCTGVQIAPHFDMCVNNFYLRVKEQYGMSFVEYCSLKRSCGDSLLLAKQFEKALKGDNVMLIWLGKNRLTQSENGAQTNGKEISETDIENTLMLTKGILAKYKEKYGEINDTLPNEPETGSELSRIDTQI